MASVGGFAEVERGAVGVPEWASGTSFAPWRAVAWKVEALNKDGAGEQKPRKHSKAGVPAGQGEFEGKPAPAH